MTSSHHYVDQVQQAAFVWHEQNWEHPDTFHSHQKGQLVFVEEGFQYLHTENKRFLLPQNHAAWIPSFVLHKTTSSASSIFLRSIYYDTEELPPFYNELRLFSVPNVLREMILYTEKWSKKTDLDLAASYFLQAILLELPAFVKDSIPLHIPIPKDGKLITITSYINQNINNNITVSQLASQFHITLRTLERLFKKETGISVAKYIQLVRIVKAVELLNENQQTISEIAYLVGYKSVQAFSSSFQNLLGRRPQAFLKSTLP